MDSISTFARGIAMLLTTALLIAGCGGSGASKQDYEQGLAQIQAELAEANESSRASGDTTDPQQRSASLVAAYTSLDKAATAAESLAAPDDIASAHDELAAALRDYAALFDKLAKLEQGSPNESELYSEAGQIVERLSTANKALESAGYAVKDDA